MIRIKASLLFVFCICCSKAFSQGNYGGGVDDDNLHFGFGFHYISSEFKIQKTANWQQPFLDGNGMQATDSIKSIRSISNPGFGIGFVSDLYITPRLNLRFTPVFVFADRIVDYEFKGEQFNGKEDAPDGFTRRKVSSTMFDFPLGLKLKSDRRNNFRAYLLGGVKYGIDLASKKNSDDEGNEPQFMFLKNNKGIFSYEVGIGFDLYFEFFKL